MEHNSIKGDNPDLLKIQVNYILMKNPSLKFQNPFLNFIFAKDNNLKKCKGQ